MPMFLIEFAIILALILANGLFSMAELAVVSARRARLQNRAESGDRGALVALELSDDPNRFLPTVQIGITLIGTLAGAFGGATLARSLDRWLERFPGLDRYSEALSVGLVVLLITYFTLVFGELVPKRLALSRPERIASLVAVPMSALSRLAVPIVRLLGGSTELIFRLFGIRPSTEPPVTEEEVKLLLKQGQEAGVFDPSEHDIVQRVFRLGDRHAGMLMTPRHEVVWIDLADSPDQVGRKIAASPHSRFPVCDGSLDNVVGVVQVKDLLLRGFSGREAFDVRGLLTMPLFLYEGMPGFQILERFRASGTHIAMVLDEYGLVEGLVTLNDIMEAIVGELSEPDARTGTTAVRGEDGSWLLDGRKPLDETAEHLGMPSLSRGGYHTLAGFVMHRLGRVPSPGDRVEYHGVRFEVVEMNGRRIEKVLVIPSPATEAGPANGAGNGGNDLGPRGSPR